MKTTLRKITRLFFALLIPTAMLIGCQEDLTEPQAGLPPKNEIKLPPGANKSE